MKVNLTCATCGSSFKRRHDRVYDGHNYCCLECRKAATSKRVKAVRGRECAQCGAEFIARGWQLKNGIGKYCSNRCSMGSLADKKASDDEFRKKWNANISKALTGRVGKSGRDNPNYKGRGLGCDGYFWVKVDGVKKPEHRHLMEVHLGRELTSDEVVHHINHVKTDNRIENLAVMTRAEHLNEHRSDYPKTALRGSRSPQSKLTEADVMAIRASSRSRAELSKQYGVTPQNIGYIVTRKTWVHC